jgi:tetratricopeptide (TPR) repeat protein
MKRSPVIGVVLAIAVGSAGADERWTEVRSPNFHVVGNAGGHAARRTAGRLEGFRSAVAQVLPGQPLADSGTTVVLFKDAASFRPLLPLYQGKRVKLGGMFVSGPDRSYMALDIDAGDDALRTVFHEYTHALTSRLPFRLPVWVNEGIAEVYSTADVRQGKVALGKPIASHVLLLRQRPTLPLETLFEVDYDSPHYNEQDKLGIFYAQSWALVHYLLMQESNRNRSLRAFIDAVAGGATGTEACRKAFGVEPAVLSKELSAYLRGWRFTYRTAPVRELSPSELVETTLAAHEGPFYLGDILVHQGRLEEARPFLEKAIALQPGFGPAHRSLGLGYLQAEDHANATRWLDAAIERDPADGHARLYRVRARMLAAGGSFGPAAAAAVHDDARRAARALPASAEASQLLVYVESVLDRRDDDAIRAVRDALRLSPERHELWSRLVHVLLARGETVEAQTAAGRLRARASTPEEKERANALLGVVAAALQPPAAEPRAEGDAAAPASVPAGGRPEGATAAPEVRAAGVLERMECRAGGRLEFTIRAGSRRLKLRASSPTAFMVYRNEERVQPDWLCGPMQVPVDVAYVPDASGNTGTVARFSIAAP